MDTVVIPVPIAFALGVILVVASVKLLFYGFDRGEYLFIVIFMFGFLPFFIGLSAVYLCFYPDPPTIFGFTIGAPHVPPLKIR